MYLILPLEEGRQRNLTEALARGATYKDAKAWRYLENDTNIMLDVGDGESDEKSRGGLSEDEKIELVAEVPKEFSDTLLAKNRETD